MENECGCYPNTGIVCSKHEKEVQKEFSHFTCSTELKEQKENILKILDKYYAECDENGNYSYDPSANQLIDILREEIIKTN